MEDSEWREVTRKKRRSVFERLGNSSYRDAFYGNNTVAVYVSNFPSHLTVREIWNICEVWIGRLRLHANIARFDRKESSRSYQADDKRQEVAVLKPIYRDDSTPKSFVNVLKDPIGNKKDSNSEHVGENSAITLSQEDNYGEILAVVGCFKDFRSIVNSKIICRNEGFQGVETKYLGGLWVMFEFKDKNVRNKFLIHEGILSWFSMLNIWNDKFVVAERLIWLEVEGVPFGAWNNDSFKIICSRWGEVLFVDDTDSTNRFSICLCLKSTHASLIFASIVATFK
ncbi:reverse transcriptase domain, reverse transcriptase zinc-binding domain protein, partial [Tanacetum coccineum]